MKSIYSVYKLSGPYFHKGEFVVHNEGQKGDGKQEEFDPVKLSTLII